MQKQILTILFLCSTLIHANATDTTQIKSEYVKVIFKERDLDFDSKSALGWARVINNPERRKEYGLNDLKENEIVMLTAELKDIYKRSSSTFEGKLK